jgi:hypothetical protein
MGMFLLRRVYEEYLSGEATRGLPVDGIKKGLVAHGRAGQFYRHLYFHIGCRFLGWPGTLASWLMHQVDVRQAATGRMESAVEIKDNVAAFACAKVLVDRSRRSISRREGCDGVPQKSWDDPFYLRCTRRRLRWRTSGKKPLTMF